LDDPESKHTQSVSLSYSVPEADVVFRIAWYVVGSQSGMLLSGYGEAESTDFEGVAQFSGKVEDTSIAIRVSVMGSKKVIELKAFGDDEAILKNYLNGTSQFIQACLNKYNELEPEDQSRLRRALVAKTCWDHIVHDILNKEVVSSIYYQLAHGREMMIKATEGDDLHPITLSTSGWLSKIENLPRDEKMPNDIATDLAKKSIEWKRDTQLFIEQYLAINL